MSPTQSTGPITPEGKKRASMNALRHGLTGRVVVLPSEDLEAWQTFCDDLMTDLKPETPIERQYAQTFCDTQWRLNRIRAIEDSILALGHWEEAGDIDPDHPEIHAALTSARVFRDDSKTFANLSLYEQRLQRTLKQSLAQLHELQAKRKAERQAALDEAVAQRNLHKMKGQPFNPADHQFVFSLEEIETEARRQYRRADAEIAKNNDYDLAQYRSDPMKQAA